MLGDSSMVFARYYFKSKIIQTMPVLILVLSAFNVSPAFAGISNISDAINKAGRQRMLTQRMYKAYCMIGLDVQTDDAREQLNAAVTLFDKQLQELIAYSPTQKIFSALQKVESLWRPFRKTITGDVEVKTAEMLLKANDNLLRQTHEVVLLLEDFSGSELGRLVNIAGRQRMLSQRLAKFYVLRAWGVDNARIRNEMERAKNEFKSALSELSAAKENTAGIKQALVKANGDWLLLKHGLERNNKKMVPLIVAMTSEKLLKSMNEITAMYAALPVEVNTTKRQN